MLPIGSEAVRMTETTRIDFTRTPIIFEFEAPASRVGAALIFTLDEVCSALARVTSSTQTALVWCEIIL